MTSEAVVDFKHERETVLKPMHAKYTSFHETCKSAERGNIWVKFEASLLPKAIARLQVFWAEQKAQVDALDIQYGKRSQSTGK